MEEIEKEITKVSERLLKAFPDLKEKIKPEPYHFIEICIIFIEYCDDLTISKGDFIAANKIFSDDEDSEDVNGGDFKDDDVDEDDESDDAIDRRERKSA